MESTHDRPPAHLGEVDRSPSARAADDSGGAEPPEGALAVALQGLLVAAEDARRAMADRMGLSENEIWAMQHVMGEALGPVEIGRRLHMSSASATVLVDRLEQAGHVRRVAHENDRRRRVVVPTDQGVAGVFQQIGPMLAGLAQAEATLDDDDIALIGSYLARATEVLAQVAHPPADAEGG